MEHIVQFAISIDDLGVEQIVKEKAAKTIIDDLKQEVRNKLYCTSYYHRNASSDDPLSSFSEGIILSVLNEEREKIIEKAAALLARRLSMSKAGKSILSNLDGCGERDG